MGTDALNAPRHLAPGRSITQGLAGSESAMIKVHEDCSLALCHEFDFILDNLLPPCKSSTGNLAGAFAGRSSMRPAVSESKH
jgi:hypothetical protein